MQKIILGLFSFILFSSAACATENNVIKTMNSIMQKYAIPGAAVILYKDGKINQYLFGVTNNKTHAPVELATIFELGSITKTFSGLLLAQEVNNGNLRLDDKLVDYLDTDNKYSDSLKEITLLELATHTSSLPYSIPNISYNSTISNPRSLKIFNQFLHNWSAPYPSGTAMLYSNPGFSLLGIAMANYKEKSLALVMQQDILQPLKMNSSYLAIPKDKMKFYSQGYTAQGSPSRSPQGGLLAGSWAMKASVTDMEQYLYLALGLKGMPPKMAEAMKIAQTPYFAKDNNSQIGLGWFITPLSKVSKAELLKIIPVIPRKRVQTPVKRIKTPEFNENALIEKTGSTNGFRAYIAVIPQQKIGIVILVNRFIYDSNIIEHTGRELLLNKI
ncbi:MAG: ampC [Burkholderiales bacterium]|jgi:beta-lactamase class C|nr:ampC [Burkholderiales bacterium]